MSMQILGTTSLSNVALNILIIDGDLRLHPIITRLVDAETLQKMGAKQARSGEK
ncbi:hypothetical protein [Roseovarius albus]|uniref:hypothetical protein n=1 Tax=Roseovarius albus TaxID=1247867 RepID=UPI00135633D5|nr:hypothetical protein [Roseovarius albus]